MLLSSGKIDKYEHLTDGEILLFNQSQIIEKPQFILSLSEIAFEKKETSKYAAGNQRKMIPDAAKKK